MSCLTHYPLAHPEALLVLRGSSLKLAKHAGRAKIVTHWENSISLEL